MGSPSKRLSRRRLLAATLSLPASAASARFEPEIDAFARADAQRASPAGALLFVGSSTIRLWPSLARRFAPTPVIQRGFGGATLADVHRHHARLFLPHHPAAVILYAGENDIAEGAAPAEVIARWRRLRRALVGTAAGWAPLVFIDLKPSPARAAGWPRMREVNRRMRALDDAPAAFVDTPAFVLDTRGRPRPELFRADGLHFNHQGYAHLTTAVKRALAGSS